MDDKTNLKLEPGQKSTSVTPFLSFLRALFALNQPPLRRPWLLSVFLLITLVVIWEFYFPSIVPRFVNIFSGLKYLTLEKGMLYELFQSTKLALRGMFFSVLIAGFVSLSGAVSHFMRPIAQGFSYFRFWSILGFAPIIRITMGGGPHFQTVLLMFGITPFLVTSFNSVLRNVQRDPLYDYARTLGYSEIKCVWYVVVRSKLSQFYIEIRNNFAIAWVMIPTVEIANRDGGGIGAMLFDYTRYVQASEDPYANSLALNLVVLSCGILIGFLFKKLILTLPEEKVKSKKS